MATSPPASYVSRESFILGRSAGKDVLHLGCIGETEGQRWRRVDHVLGPTSLHSRLIEAAKSVIGIDIDPEAIRRLREAGRGEFYVANVEELWNAELPPGLSADVVVAGDIIEHLSNPGRMLEGVKPLLRPHGELIVTTPNAFGLPNYLRFLAGRFREGEDHVLSFSQLTLRNLLRRHGWRIAEAHTGWEGRASEMYGRLFTLGRWFLERRPVLGGTLIVVCRPADTP